MQRASKRVSGRIWTHQPVDGSVFACFVPYSGVYLTTVPIPLGILRLGREIGRWGGVQKQDCKACQHGSLALLPCPGLVFRRCTITQQQTKKVHYWWTIPNCGGFCKCSKRITSGPPELEAPETAIGPTCTPNSHQWPPSCCGMPQTAADHTNALNASLVAAKLWRITPNCGRSCECSECITSSPQTVAVPDHWRHPNCGGMPQTVVGPANTLNASLVPQISGRTSQTAMGPMIALNASQWP